MTTLEIYKIMGKPLDQDCDHIDCTWFYTQRHDISFGPYDMKIISFKNGKVIEIVDEYHLD
ncbi:MAG: hypothetical protein H6621_06360 [Halobacteriovoraceae bacterium]|nr:hypothetical protein [Halobacteriovoraceae bacterium]